MAGLPKTTVANIERGQNQSPRAETLAKLAAALSVRIEALTATETGDAEAAEILAEFESSPLAAHLVPPLSDAEKSWITESGPALWGKLRPTPQTLLHFVLALRTLPAR